MATYVMSDLHGYYTAFKDMLTLIQFSGSDVLYILGDVIDRGPESLKLLYYIGTQDNMYYLKGNHEELFVHSDIDFLSWSRNGGAAFDDELTQLAVDRTVLKEWLNELPLFHTTKVNGNTFYLAHAGLIIEQSNVAKAQSYNYILWNRKNAKTDYTLQKNMFVILGHTPAKDIRCEVLGVVRSSASNDIVRINSAYFIDGEVYAHTDGQLNCIRLDDFAEFKIATPQHLTVNRESGTKIYTPSRER